MLTYNIVHTGLYELLWGISNILIAYFCNMTVKYYSFERYRMPLHNTILNAGYSVTVSENVVAVNTKA